MGDWDKAQRRLFQRIAPGPIFQNWIRKLFTDDSYQPINDLTAIRERFNTGDVVDSDMQKQAEESMKEGFPIYTNEKGERVSRKEMEKQIEKEKDMDIKNPEKAAVGAGAITMTPLEAQMNNAQEKFILPKEKPKIEKVEKSVDYSKLPNLSPEKQKFLLDAAKVIFTNNRNDSVPSDILLAIAIEETGYGTGRFYKEGNNYFNMVAEKGDERIKAKGDETVVAKFKEPSGSIEKFYSWVDTKPHYKVVRDTINLYREGKATKEDIIDAISSTGWAENENWSKNVKAILKKRVNGKHKNELKTLANSLFNE